MAAAAKLTGEEEDGADAYASTWNQRLDGWLLQIATLRGLWSVKCLFVL